jgi:hypothetical protein
MRMEFLLHKKALSKHLRRDPFLMIKSLKRARNRKIFHLLLKAMVPRERFLFSTRAVTSFLMQFIKLPMNWDNIGSTRERTI